LVDGLTDIYTISLVEFCPHSTIQSAHAVKELHDIYTTLLSWVEICPHIYYHATDTCQTRIDRYLHDLARVGRVTQRKVPHNTTQPTHAMNMQDTDVPIFTRLPSCRSSDAGRSSAYCHATHTYHERARHGLTDIYTTSLVSVE
jgi:hypothetical protein